MSLNILITGYCGYIGSALVEFLTRTSFVNTIVGYDLRDGNDILSYKSLVYSLKANKIDLVIHLAGVSSVTKCNENINSAIKVNGYGTYLLLKAMKEAKCNNIIYASTSSVYGVSFSPYTEDDKLRPCSVYGISKLLGEHVIYNHYDLQRNPGSYLIFRMFNVIGSSGFPQIDKLANFERDNIFGSMQTGRVIIYGKDHDTFDGTCEDDYIALKDVCMAYIKGIHAIYTNKVIRSTINICSGIPTSTLWIIQKWNDTHRAIRNQTEGYDKCNKLPYVKYRYDKRREGDIGRIYGSFEKAMYTIRWKPKRKIENIIFDFAMDKKF